MAGEEPKDMLRVKTTYTFNEAIEYMKREDKRPVDINRGSTRWYDVRTGKEVSIGYTYK